MFFLLDCIRTIENAQLRFGESQTERNTFQRDTLAALPRKFFGWRRYSWAFFLDGNARIVIRALPSMIYNNLPRVETVVLISDETRRIFTMASPSTRYYPGLSAAGSSRSHFSANFRICFPCKFSEGVRSRERIPSCLYAIERDEAYIEGKLTVDV